MLRQARPPTRRNTGGRRGRRKHPAMMTRRALRHGSPHIHLVVMVAQPPPLAFGHSANCGLDNSLDAGVGLEVRNHPVGPFDSVIVACRPL
jgi:hypothetical protein